MGASTHATGERIAGPEPRPAIDAGLLTVGDVARLLRCSQRSVYRLSDAGRMPRPVRLGALVRWSRTSIEEWVEQGCPAVRHVGAKGGPVR